MKPTDRRTFMIQLTAAGSALAATQLARAQAGPALAENDPQAVALGYKEDSAKVDKAKFPKHDAAQKCNNCQLYQGKPADAAGGCPLFAGKQVKGAGWCSAWAKKA